MHLKEHVIQRTLVGGGVGVKHRISPDCHFKVYALGICNRYYNLICEGGKKVPITSLIT